MNLITKPDIERAERMWDAYWEKEIIDRPLAVASVPKPGRRRPGLGHSYMYALESRIDERLAMIDRWVDNTIFLAEAIPVIQPDVGPDQFAAFLGADIEYSEDSPNTNWITPVVEEWETFLPIHLDEDNPTWKKALEFSRRVADHGIDRYLVGAGDLHSNADALSALRGPERFCLDFYDCPDLVEEAMRQVRPLYRPVYERLYEAGRMGGPRGSMGWAPFWSRGKFATIQCDFLALVGPEIGRRYILPALEEEAQYLDHCVYHLDGPDCLVHLDDLLSIEAIDVIQWVPGAGNAPVYEWLDLLKRCQEYGKGLQIGGINDIEIIKSMTRELNPEGVVYCLQFDTEAEVEKVLAWLKAHT